MLDSDTPTPTDAPVDAGSEAPAAPRRRRRAASRPAGPPAPVTSVPPAVVVPADEATATDDQPEQAEPVAGDEVAAESNDTPQAADEVAAETTDTPEVAEEADAADPDASDQAEDADEATVPAEDDEVVADESADTTDQANEPQNESGDEQAAPQASDDAVEPAATEPPSEGRRRGGRGRKRAEIEVVETVQPEPAAAEPLSLDQLPTLDEVATAPARPRSGGRRRKAEPTEKPTEDIDPLASSLEELSRTGAPTPARDVDEDAAAHALEELAAAIGGRDQASAEDSDDNDDDEATDAEDATSEDDGEDEGPRRRRRRRGGRRRRRSGDRSDSDADNGSDSDNESDGGSDDDESDGADAETDADGETDSDGDSDNGDSSGRSRRRRRRRRRGEDTTGAEDDPSDVVVRVREPRRAKGSDEVTGIEGSTRMEAKRQRRRDGRAAGRRRTPILSEAEFLARREAVDRAMLIRQADDYTQIAVLEDGILVEHYVDRASATSMIGNVYLGKVQNVLPSMEAAFIDIGRGRNAVLYAGEMDWEAFGVTGGDRKMEKVLKSGQSVLVQVSKDPVGAKGARLTAHVSLPGRYVVYSPGGQLSGISRKLPEPERNRLKGILEEVVGETASVIVRTAAEGASEEELVRDVNRLKAQWEVIDKKVQGGKSPQLLYAEPDLTVRIVRDLFTEDFGKLVVDGNGKGEDAWDTVDGYVTHVAPHLKERLHRWDREASGDIFAAHRIDEQIAKALERKVFLPSGGSLIIDRTEAMTVIDVNTGKFTGTSGNLEATVTSNNLEAADEIVRQLRLRDIGGIIVIDFIDMVLPANRELLLRRLVECLGRDRTRHQVAEVTSLGLVQMTRKRIGTGLAEAFTVTCETCQGRGYHRHDTPVDTQAQADGGERENGRRRRH